MSLINSEDKRSYSTLNIFFVLKFFFERKKSSVNMAMNSHSIFRLAENGVKMNSLLCGNTLCYEMSFNDFRFQLNEELSLLFDHGNRTLREKNKRKARQNHAESIYYDNKPGNLYNNNYLVYYHVILFFNSLVGKIYINITHNATTMNIMCFFLDTLCQVFSYFSRDFKGI